MLKGLARLLALTGRIEDYDALEGAVTQLQGGVPGGTDWYRAREMRLWAARNPTEAYKCGLYCLDQLGRLTQPGQFAPSTITETESSPAGFTAADLLSVAAMAGLKVHAAALVDGAQFPVPCILHLRSEHFVVLREQRGAFYDVFDPVADGRRWLTVADIAEEASGCVLVSDAAPLEASAPLVAIDGATAAQYRGRCHGPTASYHYDSPCPDCPCPPGKAGAPGTKPSQPSSPGRSGGNTGAASGGSGGASAPACGSCATLDGGAPTWFVSEPTMHLWLEDMPLQYQPAYGPEAALRLNYNPLNDAGLVSGWLWHGATLGNSVSTDGTLGYGLWSCSWFSFAELDSSGNMLDVALPQGGWATFDFPYGSTNVSSVEYFHNMWAEKTWSGGNVTSVTIHYTDGSRAVYGVLDSATAAAGGYAGLFYLSSRSDTAGNSITLSYDAKFHLSTVAAADGATFTLHYASAPYSNNVVSSITTSYGPSVSFGYSTPAGQHYYSLTNITDAAGISSDISYLVVSGNEIAGGDPTALVTPCGTTSFSTLGDAYGQGIFDSTVRITRRTRPRSSTPSSPGILWATGPTTPHPRCPTRICPWAPWTQPIASSAIRSIGMPSSLLT